METSLRLRGADSTTGQHGLRIHAKQKLSLPSNALLQAQAEIDTSTGKPSHLALLARRFFPELSANVGVGVQVEQRPLSEKKLEKRLSSKKKVENRNIIMYSLRGKKAFSFTSDGLLGLNIKGRLLADKDFKVRGVLPSSCLGQYSTSERVRISGSKPGTSSTARCLISS
ncbi:unnamed protein product [Alopecurus aequalis]